MQICIAIELTICLFNNYTADTSSLEQIFYTVHVIKQAEDVIFWTQGHINVGPLNKKSIKSTSLMDTRHGHTSLTWTVSP